MASVLGGARSKKMIYQNQKEKKGSTRLSRTTLCGKSKQSETIVVSKAVIRNYLAFKNWFAMMTHHYFVVALSPNESSDTKFF
ncbi:hypothetical protein H8K52_03910 [Undibacterium seohonense]|uniref:Uncharacterized protein n=1 Tax=Undibacterium seohonense TaxID=1344950 RepID=A0ABR6X0M6_9BURK|nr:hypothetical protein [Undibacterium seohonense]MBC3806494.1 hypothetical protein [Undibacterium seohonense]